MRRPLLAASLAVALAAGGLVPGGDAASARAAEPRVNLAAARVRLQRVVSGLSRPIALAWRSGNAPPMYVAEQGGRIVAVANGRIVRTVLRVSVSQGSERGLLGMAFSRNGAKLYVDHTDRRGDIRIAEYRMRNGIADPATRRVLMVIPHRRFGNHNGGNLVMGPGNLLYISTGDGGGGGDTLGNGQNLNSLLGKILRIDPRRNGAKPYRIPPGNPFAGRPNRKGEIWMYGLRNPWRFSFDRKTHDIWIGDVGQNAWEEIDYARAGTKGVNWGWNLREGKHPYDGGARPPGARDPILERSHDDGDCSIIGGYVSRGPSTVPLRGAYVFGDLCTGIIRAIVQSGGRVTQRADLGIRVPQLSTFGRGPNGALFAVSLGGTVDRIVRRQP
jgi:glucose/arabinose dehydrogenase